MSTSEGRWLRGFCGILEPFYNYTLAAAFLFLLGFFGACRNFFPLLVLLSSDQKFYSLEDVEVVSS